MRLETLTNGTRIYISDSAGFSADPLLLADFMRIKNGSFVLDAGTGNGIIPLKLYDNGLRFRCVAAEINSDAASLAERSFSENGITDFTVYSGDVREFSRSEKFDAVISNPPYFKNGVKSPDAYRLSARHDGMLTLEELFKTAARNLKEGGNLSFCCRPESLQRAMTGLSESGLSAKRIRFVREKENHEPFLLLIEARYRSGEGAVIMKDFIIRKESGELTDQAARITAPHR